MAFVKATIEVKPAAIGTGIKVSLRQTKKSAAKMGLSFNEAVGKSLGFSDGDKVEIMLGEKEHHGLVRLRKNNSAGQAMLRLREAAKGKWFSLPLGHQPAFVDRSETPAWCQWEKVEDGWIEIVLPRWADETAPGKVVRPETSTQPVVQQIKRGTSVTSSLMGDPAPGRSALAAKA